MNIIDAKVGQKVFVKRESTAKLDGLDSVLNTIIKMANKCYGLNIVEQCKENGGFYIARIEGNNVALGDKDNLGVVDVGWGWFDASDVELAEQPQNNESNVNELFEKILKHLEIQTELLSKLSAQKTCKCETKPKTKK